MCCVALPCCLFDLACFFLPSFSSLIKTCIPHLSNSKRKYSLAFIDFIERPVAGYPRSEDSGAKVEVYLGRATSARSWNWKIYKCNFVTVLSTSLWSSLPLTRGRIRGLGLASALKHTYTLQHNPTAALWLFICTVCIRFPCSTPRNAQRRQEART